MNGSFFSLFPSLFWFLSHSTPAQISFVCMHACIDVCVCVFISSLDTISRFIPLQQQQQQQQLCGGVVRVLFYCAARLILLCLYVCLVFIFSFVFVGGARWVCCHSGQCCWPSAFISTLPINYLFQRLSIISIKLGVFVENSRVSRSYACAR